MAGTLLAVVPARRCGPQHRTHGFADHHDHPRRPRRRGAAVLVAGTPSRSRSSTSRTAPRGAANPSAVTAPRRCPACTTARTGSRRRLEPPAATRGCVPSTVRWSPRRAPGLAARTAGCTTASAAPVGAPRCRAAARRVSAGGRTARGSTRSAGPLPCGAEALRARRCGEWGRWPGPVPSGRQPTTVRGHLDCRAAHHHPRRPPCCQRWSHASMAARTSG